ncbi:hypothetical protein EB077_12310, partial [bacterium]|nr:hypothetical protein [bacterium]
STLYNIRYVYTVEPDITFPAFPKFIKLTQHQEEPVFCKLHTVTSEYPNVGIKTLSDVEVSTYPAPVPEVAESADNLLIKAGPL